MVLDYSQCKICPRDCGINRTSQKGFCGCGDKARVAKTMLHFWEEPCISGKNGSGAVFFSGCNLRCAFCQNRDISFSTVGKELSDDELALTYLKLQAQGAHNINLITAAPYLINVINSLKIAKPRLTVPVVYNSGGYEKAEAIATLDGLVDVYLPDLKYYSKADSEKYSAAKDYNSVAIAAIDEMVRQQPRVVIEDGIIKQGVIIRHLILPGHKDDSNAVVRQIAERWKGHVLVSIMRQYTPEFASASCDLKRKVTSYEYNEVLECVRNNGLDGYAQDKESANSAYTPKFKV